METLFSMSPMVIAMVPIVLGMTQIAKEVGLPSKYASLFSVFIGVSFMALLGGEWQIAIAQGTVVGLLASGLWSGTKSLLKA